VGSERIGADSRGLDSKQFGVEVEGWLVVATGEKQVLRCAQDDKFNYGAITSCFAASWTDSKMRM